MCIGSLSVCLISGGKHCLSFFYSPYSLFADTPTSPGCRHILFQQLETSRHAFRYRTPTLGGSGVILHTIASTGVMAPYLRLKLKMLNTGRPRAMLHNFAAPAPSPSLLILPIPGLRQRSALATPDSLGQRCITMISTGHLLRSITQCK